MYEDLVAFAKQNKSSCISFIIVILVCVSCIWFLHDYNRNQPVYQDSNSSMELLEARIAATEQRITAIQERLDAAEKTVNGISATIESSRNAAITIKEGLGTAEERLDSIIQRQGNIANIITDIEAENRKGTQDP